MRRPLRSTVLVFVLAAAACGEPAVEEADPATTVTSSTSTIDGSSSSTPNSDTTTPTTRSGDDAPATTTTTENPDTLSPPEPAVVALVTALAADELGGRDNRSDGSAEARELLVAQLETFAEPLFGSGANGWFQAFSIGTNVAGLIRGAERPGEYIVLGAHYDALPSEDCDAVDDDRICNGATDNATGVAAIMEVGRRLAATGTSRSVVIAFWDAEEDNLRGSESFVRDPPFALGQVRLYVNLDLQGINLLPTLRSATSMIGAETGGAEYAEIAADVGGASPLTLLPFSFGVGQGRSDYRRFAEREVPIVAFTDGTGGCYHTVGDEVGVVDFDKLQRQIELVENLVTRVDQSDAPRVFEASPVVTRSDLESLLWVLERVVDDPVMEDLINDDHRDFVSELRDLIADAPDEMAFSTITPLMEEISPILNRLERQECQGHLAS